MANLANLSSLDAMRALLATLTDSEKAELAPEIVADPVLQRVVRVKTKEATKVESEAKKAERAEREAQAEDIVQDLHTDFGELAIDVQRQYAALPGVGVEAGNEDGVTLKLTCTMYVQDGRKEGYARGSAQVTVHTNMNDLEPRGVTTEGKAYTGSQKADPGMVRFIEKTGKVATS